MTETIILTIKLEGNEVKRFEEARVLSGIRTNSEFVRFLASYYIKGESK